MNELDYLEDVYFGKKQVKDEKELVKLRGLYEHCWVMKPPAKPSLHVPYNLLAFLAKMSPKDNAKGFISETLESYGYLKKNELIDAELVKRLEFAFNWVRDFEEIKETPISLSEEEKNAITILIPTLENEIDPEKIQNAIFNSAKNNELLPRGFFRTLYTILLGVPQGPRLGSYMITMGRKNVIEALQRALAKSS